LAPQLCLLFGWWHASVVGLPPCDVILAQLACPLNVNTFLFTFSIAILLSTDIGEQPIYRYYMSMVETLSFPKWSSLIARLMSHGRQLQMNLFNPSCQREKRMGEPRPYDFMMRHDNQRYDT